MDIFSYCHFHIASKECSWPNKISNFMHGFKSAIFEKLKKCQNGTFEDMHEIFKRVSIRSPQPIKLRYYQFGAKILSLYKNDHCRESMASLRLKSVVDAGRIMPNIKKVPSLWSVKVAYSQDFFLRWLHRPKTCSKSLSVRRLVIKWLLLQNCLKFSKTPFFSSKSFPLISAGPQKPQKLTN